MSEHAWVDDGETLNWRPRVFGTPEYRVRFVEADYEAVHGHTMTQAIDALADVNEGRVVRTEVMTQAILAAQGTASPAPDVWISSSDACKYLGISLKTLDRRRQDCPSTIRPPFRKVSKRVMWKKPLLDKWIEEMSEYNRRRRRGGR